MQTLKTRGWWIAALAVLLGIGATAIVAHAQAQERHENRVALGRDLVKLGIVVMANQTPITPSDAQAVLPALQAMREKDTLSEADAAALDANLQAALPSTLRQAVQVVRLPEPSAEQQARFHAFMTRRHTSGNPLKSGPGSKAFNHLVQFFADAAK
jgi:hypothetical protein